MHAATNPLARGEKKKLEDVIQCINNSTTVRFVEAISFFIQALHCGSDLKNHCILITCLMEKENSGLAINRMKFPLELGESFQHRFPFPSSSDSNQLNMYLANAGTVIDQQMERRA